MPFLAFFLGAWYAQEAYESQHASTAPKIFIGARSGTSGISGRTQAPNFSRTGTLTGSATQGWTLVYEESGQPALNSKVIFDNSSLCLDSQGLISCTLVNWESGTRMRIEGFEENGTVRVYNLTVLSE